MKNLYVTLICLFAAAKCYTQNCSPCNFPGWSHFQKVVINNGNNPNTLTNFQVPVTLNTQLLISQGKMKNDGSDVRFTSLCSGGTNYDYWIEGVINTNSTKFWVKIPSIAAQTIDTMYLHYGNPGASAVASGSLTFDIFEDFSSGSLANWTFSGGTWTITSLNNNNVLQCTNPASGNGHAGLLTSNIGFNNYVVEVSNMVTANSVYGGPLFEHNDFGNYFAYHYMVDQQNTMQSLISNGGSNYSIQDAASVSLNTWHPWSMKRIPPVLEHTFNGVFTRTLTSMFTDGVGVWTYGTSAGMIYFDNLRVRKASTITPTVTNGLQFVTSQVQPTMQVTASSTVVCATNPVTLSASGVTSYSWSNGSTGSMVVVNPQASSNYTVIGTHSAALCSVIKTISITANQPPSVSVTGIFTLCNTSGTGLFANGADTYSWSNGASGASVYVTPSVSSTFSVTGTNTVTGCSKTVTVPLLVHPIPIVTINTQSPGICPGQSAMMSASGANTYSWMNMGVTTSTIVVSPSVTSQFMAHGYNQFGCEGHSIITITVYPSPTVSIADGSVCIGDSYTFNPSGAVNYSFSSISNVVTPQVNASYQVWGSDLNGCQSDTVTFNVTVNPLPVITASFNPIQICAGEKSIMYAGGATTYSWHNGTSTGTANVNPIITTVYTVTGTDNNGCVSKTFVSLKVNKCTGIAPVSADSRFINIYPNPASPAFIISSSQDCALTVFDATGRIVRVIVLSTENNFRMQVSDLIPGLYFIREKQSGVQRVVVSDR